MLSEAGERAGGVSWQWGSVRKPATGSSEKVDHAEVAMTRTAIRGGGRSDPGLMSVPGWRRALRPRLSGAAVRVAPVVGLSRGTRTMIRPPLALGMRHRTRHDWKSARGGTAS